MRVCTGKLLLAHATPFLSACPSVQTICIAGPPWLVVLPKLRFDVAMSAKGFFGEDMKEATKAAVAAAESRTSVEVVVCVRRQSGVYRHADYLFGAILLFAVLMPILFAEFTFALEAIPLELLAAFVLGTVVCSMIPVLRRLLTRASYREKAVRSEARAAFYDLGIARTRDRTGLLLFVSLLENRLEVVPDIGIDLKSLGEGWAAELHKAVEAQDPQAFLKQVRALGEPLGKAYPRRDDDINELSDEVAA